MLKLPLAHSDVFCALAYSAEWQVRYVFAYHSSRYALKVLETSVLISGCVVEFLFWLEHNLLVPKSRTT